MPFKLELKIYLCATLPCTHVKVWNHLIIFVMTSYYKNEMIAQLDFVENYKIAKYHCEIAKWINSCVVRHLSGWPTARRQAFLLYNGFKEAYWKRHKLKSININQLSFLSNVGYMIHLRKWTGQGRQKGKQKKGNRNKIQLHIIQEQWRLVDDFTGDQEYISSCSKMLNVWPWTWWLRKRIRWTRAAIAAIVLFQPSV